MSKDDEQWIDELRVALQRGCDFGSIRNIGKCRPLPVDLRLAVWKVKRKTSIENEHFFSSGFLDVFKHRRKSLWKNLRRQ